MAHNHNTARSIHEGCRTTAVAAAGYRTDMADPYTSGQYAIDNPDWHEADAEHKARALASMIRYAGLRPRTVIDVGCGTGGVLWHLSHTLAEDLPGTAWEGWDVAPEAIRRARKREGGNLHFVAEDFLASEREADLLLLIDVVEHVPDDVAFLRGLRDRARWFLIRLPLDLSAWDVARSTRLLEARRRYGHRHVYTRELALQLLGEAGYEVEKVVYDRVPPPRETARQRLVDGLRETLFQVAPALTVRLLGGYSVLVLARAAPDAG